MYYQRHVIWENIETVTGVFWEANCSTYDNNFGPTRTLFLKFTTLVKTDKICIFRNLNSSCFQHEQYIIQGIVWKYLFYKDKHRDFFNDFNAFLKGIDDWIILLKQ